MSHFSVLVVGPDVEKQLAPFQENNMGDCPKELLEFHETETESLAEYEIQKTDCFVSPDGKPHCKYDDRFRAKPMDFLAGTKYECPVGWTEREVSVKEIYPTFEQYMAEYCGSKERDPVIGRYGYWENPNAKWDWYRVGGRWAGHFKLKAGVTAPAPQPGYEVEFGQEVPEANTADTAAKSEIDFEGMREDAVHDAALEYDFVASIFGDLPPHKAWSEFSDIEDIEKRRETYRAQPRLIAWAKAGDVSMDERRKMPVDVGWGDADKFIASREQYINSARLRAGTTFAVVLNGKWYERGEMGWWACVSNEKDEETWMSMFHKMLNELPGDTQLTVVDCHI
jgi:hypothetical protein